LISFVCMLYLPSYYCFSCFVVELCRFRVFRRLVVLLLWIWAVIRLESPVVKWSIKLSRQIANICASIGWTWVEILLVLLETSSLYAFLRYVSEKWTGRQTEEWNAESVKTFSHLRKSASSDFCISSFSLFPSLHLSFRAIQFSFMWRPTFFCFSFFPIRWSLCVIDSFYYLS
jgi:hypothetical protein